MTDEYRKDQIIRVAVPQWHRRADGRWIREWLVQLVGAPPADWSTRLAQFPGDGMETIATLDADGRTLHITCLTELEPLSDEMFLVAAYRMLERIDQGIGQIEQIQGQPRDVWQPFRTR
jgi:hypothetical protein